MVGLMLKDFYESFYIKKIELYTTNYKSVSSYLVRQTIKCQ